MPFGSLGPVELIFILLIVLLVFGAKRVPEIGSSLGKGIREFKNSIRDLQSEMDTTPDPREDEKRRELHRGSDPAPAAPEDSRVGQEENRVGPK